MLRSLETSNYLTVGCLFLLSCGLAWAQEGEVVEQPRTPRAYDQALLRFNNNIESYPSWEAFKTAVLTKVPLGATGTCYALTGGSFNSMETINVEFQGMESDRWQETSGKGWRLLRKDRTFTEYRLNLKAGLLLRIEGVKPRFFFANTQRICEFPL
jgi:hypothetical protein